MSANGHTRESDPWTEGQLPATWAKTSFGDLCDVVRGGSPRPMGDPQFFGGEIPFLKIADVTASDGMTVHRTETTVTKEGAARSRSIQAGRLILTNSATVCVPVFLGMDACIHDGFLAFDNLPESINQRYLYYFFKYVRPFVLNKHKQGITQVNLNTGIVSEMSFLLPPSREQARIVAKIEELFSELEKGVEALTTVREQLAVYRLTLLDQAVSGSLLVSRGLCKTPFHHSAWKPLSEIVSELGQGWSPRCLNHPSPGNDVWAVITTTSIQHGLFQDGENKELPAQLQPRPHLTISVGDILVTRAGPRKRVGVVCLVRKCRPRLMLCDKAYRLQVRTDRVTPEWLEFVLNSPRVLQEIEELKTGISDSGVNLTQDRFLALNVPVPSLGQQEEAVKILETAMSQVTNMEDQVETTLLQTAALRQSILKQAFSGKLVVQDPTDEPASVLLDRIRAQRGHAAMNKGHKVQMKKNSKENAA